MGKKTDELSVWHSCSKSEGKIQVTNTTVELTKAQRVIKAFQQYFAFSPIMLRYVFQLAILVTLQVVFMGGVSGAGNNIYGEAEEYIRLCDQLQ